MLLHISKFMKIENKQIGKNNPIFIIAEAGVNHNNKLSLGYKMIDIAAKYGADAIKFQTFVTENINLKNSIKPNYQKSIKKKNFNSEKWLRLFNKFTTNQIFFKKI